MYIYTLPFSHYKTNDPSAGSPTNALLRLLDSWLNHYRSILTAPTLASEAKENLVKMILTPIQATGGVYKKQERFQCEMIIHIYMKFLFHEDTYNTSIQINYLIALSVSKRVLHVFLVKM